MLCAGRAGRRRPGKEAAPEGGGGGSLPAAQPTFSPSLSAHCGACGLSCREDGRHLVATGGSVTPSQPRLGARAAASGGSAQLRRRTRTHRGPPAASGRGPAPAFPPFSGPRSRAPLCAQQPPGGVRQTLRPPARRPASRFLFRRWPRQKPAPRRAAPPGAGGAGAAGFAHSFNRCCPGAVLCPGHISDHPASRRVV